MAELRAGERIGPYQIEMLIGKGGMGAVYLAHDRSLDRRVAIKVLPERFLGDREVVARFHREALALAKLRHPNLMHIYKVGSHGGRPFFAMEYVKGRTVEALIEQTGRIPPPQAAHIAAEVMSALDKVHRAGIIHRDIKPGNIMIDEDGRAILMDFGLARQETDVGLTADHTVLGTPRYMSPEQAKGEKVDARSDIYSLGCVIYEMVTGRPPFRGKSAVEVLRKHIESTVPPPSELADDVPPALDQVIARATAKRPADRTQSVAEMAADLAGLYRIGPLVRLAAASGQGAEPTARTPVARADYPSTVRLRRTVRSSPARPRRRWPRLLLRIGIGAAAGVLLGLVLLQVFSGGSEGPGPRGPDVKAAGKAGDASKKSSEGPVPEKRTPPAPRHRLVAIRHEDGKVERGRLVDIKIIDDGVTIAKIRAVGSDDVRMVLIREGDELTVVDEE